MKKYNLLSLVLLCSLVILATCKKDNNDPSVSFDLLAEQQIGPEGGSLNVSDNMMVSIPAGSFSTSTTLQAYSSNEENPFSDNGGASEVFYLKGLPDNFTKAVRVALKHDGTALEDTYIGWGFRAIATSSFDTVFGHSLLPAEDSSGFLVSMILPEQKSGRDMEGEDHSHQGRYGVPFFCVKNLFYHQTDHFIIYFNSKYYELGTITSLAGGLEDAYLLLKNWGFEYTDRTSWPIHVEVTKVLNKKTGEPEDGQSLRSFPYTANCGYIEISQEIVDDHSRMRVTGGHEFFHVVQDLYNFDEKYNWLQEASSTWFESYLTLDPQNNIPKNYSNNKVQPFFGLQRGVTAGNGENSHGYGCAAAVKYQIGQNNQSHDPKTILEVWKAARQGKEPVEALQSFLMTEPLWYPEFLKNHFLSQIYADSVHKIFTNTYFQYDHGGTWDIDDQQDINMEFHNLGWDLSGEVYKVTPKYKQMYANTSLSVHLDGENNYLYAFRFEKATKKVVLVGESASDITIDLLKDYADKGDIIYVLLATYGATAPHYNGTNPATITMKATQLAAVSSFETQANCVSEYFSGIFNITIETDDDYPFVITRNEMNDGCKWLELDFETPPAGEVVTFNIYMDTVSLSSTQPGKIEIYEARWQVNDMNQHNYIYLGPYADPFYHMTAKYTSSISAGPCDLYLSMKINSPYFENGLSVLMLDFNMK